MLKKLLLSLLLFLPYSVVEAEPFTAETLSERYDNLAHDTIEQRSEDELIQETLGPHFSIFSFTMSLEGTKTKEFFLPRAIDQSVGDLERKLAGSKGPSHTKQNSKKPTCLLRRTNATDVGSRKSTLPKPAPSKRTEEKAG